MNEPIKTFLVQGVWNTFIPSIADHYTNQWIEVEWGADLNGRERYGHLHVGRDGEWSFRGQTSKTSWRFTAAYVKRWRRVVPTDSSRVRPANTGDKAPSFKPGRWYRISNPTVPELQALPGLRVEYELTDPRDEPIHGTGVFVGGNGMPVQLWSDTLSKRFGLPDIWSFKLARDQTVTSNIPKDGEPSLPEDYTDYTSFPKGHWFATSVTSPEHLKKLLGRDDVEFKVSGIPGIYSGTVILSSGVLYFSAISGALFSRDAVTSFRIKADDKQATRVKSWITTTEPPTEVPSSEESSMDTRIVTVTVIDGTVGQIIDSTTGTIVWQSEPCQAELDVNGKVFRHAEDIASDKAVAKRQEVLKKIWAD